jgi:alpha-L-fucosidase
MNAQIAELAGGDYGELGGFWLDGFWDQLVDEADKSNRSTRVDWKLQETYDLIHRLQPQALIGNNHHLPPFPGESFQMFERDLPGRNEFGYNTTEVGALPLESCDTVNRSWGFNASDRDFKSSRELIHYLVRAAGYDANLLLNVGPTPRGTIEPEVAKRLADVGAWTREWGESIYGTRGGPMLPQPWGVMTIRGSRAYLHLLDEDAPETLLLPGTSGLRVEMAVVLGRGRPIAFSKDGDVEIRVPRGDRDPVDTVILLALY